MRTKKKILDILSKEDIDVFWDKVQMAGKTKCWPWIGATHSRDGGPIFNRGSGKPNSMLQQLAARRVAWALVNQEEPNFIRNTCGNELCCNPAHMEDYPEPDPNTSFVKWMQTLNYNVLDASKALGVSDDQIRDYMRGMTKPKYATLVLMHLLAQGEKPKAWAA